MSALARLWSLREERPVLVALSLGVLAWLAAYPLVDLWLRGAGVAPAFRFWDFGAYGGAIDRWLSGEPIYITDADGAGYHGRYLYPPAALLVFLPFFGLLEFRGAAILFQVVSVLLLWTGLRRAIEACGADLAGWERWGLLWVVLGFQPLLLGMKLGQTAAFLTGMLALALATMLAGDAGDDGSGRTWTGSGLATGLLTGLVVAIKLPYAPACASLLRDRSRLLGAALAGVGVAAVSVGLFGVDAVVGFLDVLRWGLSRGGTGRALALWLPPLYQPLSWLPAATLLRYGISLGIAAVVVLAGDGVDREAFALGVAAVPLLAPRTYAYYFVAALPAVVALLAAEFDRRDGRPEIPVVAVFLLSVHSYGLKLLVDVLPRAVPATKALLPLAPVLQPGLWGNVLLVGLAATRVVQGIPTRSLLPEGLLPTDDSRSGVGSRGSSGSEPVEPATKRNQD